MTGPYFESWEHENLVKFAKEAYAKLQKQANYTGDIAQSLTNELFEVVHKYDESLLVATVLGCLEIVKQQILIDHIEFEDDDE